MSDVEEDAFSEFSDKVARLDEDSDEESEEEEPTVAVGHCLHPAISSYMYAAMGSDSNSPDDSSTVKCGTWSDSYISAGCRNSSTSDSSSTSGKLHKQDVSLQDTTRCDDDFQWIKSEPIVGLVYDKASHQITSAPDTDEEETRKIVQSKRTELGTKYCSEKPPVPTNHDRHSAGSLDRRRYHPPNRAERDQKSKSTHNLKSSHFSPNKYGSNNYKNHSDSSAHANSYHVDYVGNHVHDNQGQDYGLHYHHSFTPPRQLNEFQRRAISYEHFNRRHEHNDPQRYGSNSMLTDHRTESSKDPYSSKHSENDNYYNYHHSDMRNMPYYYGSRSDLHGSHSELSYYRGPPYPGHPPCCFHSAPPPWCACSDQGRYRVPYSCKVY